MSNQTDTYPASGIEAKDAAAPDAAKARGGTEPSRKRLLLFKGVALLFSLLLLAMFNVVFLMIVVSWLPDATYLGIISDLDTADLAHRFHDSIIPVISWAALGGALVQLYRPQDRVAPLLMALSIPVTFVAVELATGTYTVMGTAPTLFPLLLLALLHPRARALLRFRPLDRTMAGLVAVAAIPLLAFAYQQARLQLLGVPGDAHAAMEHWNRTAVFALLLLVWGVIGASAHPGWRLTAWVTALAAAWFGLQSLLFPTAASTLAIPWAVVALIWAGAYLLVAERRARVT